MRARDILQNWRFDDTKGEGQDIKPNRFNHLRRHEQRSALSQRHFVQ